jgi:hypothetical protein
VINSLLCNSLPHCALEGVFSTTGPPACTKTPGVSRIYQNFFLHSCGYSISFWYRTSANFIPLSESDTFSVEILLYNDVGPVITTLIEAPPTSFTTSDWQLYTCAACDGTCGLVNLTPFVGQFLTIALTYNSITTDCGGVLWDDVCIPDFIGP